VGGQVFFQRFTKDGGHLIVGMQTPVSVCIPPNGLEFKIAAGHTVLAFRLDWLTTHQQATLAHYRAAEVHQAAGFAAQRTRSFGSALWVEPPRHQLY